MASISLVDDDGAQVTATFHAMNEAHRREQQGFDDGGGGVCGDDDDSMGRHPLASARTVFDYLRSAGDDAINRLYGKGTDLDPECVSVSGSGSAPMPHRSGHSVTWTVRAVLRSLPPLAQQYCLRLMVSGGMGG